MKYLGASTTSAMGNGAKAQQKRDRAAKSAPKEAKSSQKKVNEQAKNIQCSVCKQTFLVTARQPALDDHASNRHSKSLDVCFPTFVKS